MNANADGDTPIDGGGVSVFRCAARPVGAASPSVHPMRRSTGALAEPTNDAGVALLDFDRLPDCYLVGVSGGQANGATLQGCSAPKRATRAARS